jgi:hypothetical protein
VRRAIQAGKLKASLIGGRWIVKDTAVEEWIEGSANTPVPFTRMPEQRRSRRRGPGGGAMRPGSIADLESIRDRIVGP